MKSNNPLDNPTPVTAATRRDFLKKTATVGALAAVALATGGEGFAAETLGGATSLPLPLPEKSLLDEGGMMHNPPPPKTVAAWRRELGGPVADPDRRASLHLLVGECDLALREQPEDALAHFAAARALAPAHSPLHGRAWFDHAFALYMNGQYRDAAHSFNDLLHQTDPAPVGFDRRAAAFRLRHAGACAAGHDALSDLGIPRPRKIDALCAVAGLAVSLKALGLPCDKRLMKSVVRHTGRGSNDRDLVAACDKLRAMGKADVKAHVLAADEEGLRHLPKPVIAHVEHDHFVTVIAAGEAGVSYLCTDCGPWPGGRVDLSWEQWRAMQADGYVCVVKAGGEADRVLAKLLAPDAGREEAVAGFRFPGIRVAMNPFRPGQRLGGVSELSAMFRGLRGHVAALAVNGPGASVMCGFAPGYPTCPPNACCLFGGGAGGAGGPGAGGGPGGSGGAGGPGAGGGPGSGDGGGFPMLALGASAGDPVNLATLEEEYAPAPDLTVYNPTGPGVVWQRSYRSGRGFDAACDFTDFGKGWTHSYNYVVYDPAPINVTPASPNEVPVGANRTVPVTGSNAAAGGGGQWEIWKGGTQLLSGTMLGPGVNGWQVSGGSSGLVITVPVTAAQGADYEARFLTYQPYPGGVTAPLSALFAVGRQASQPAANTTKYLQFPNGGRVAFTNAAVPNASTPATSCAVPAGNPFSIILQWNSDNTVSYVVTFGDQTRMIFNQARLANATFNTLRQTSDRAGNALAFRYQDILSAAHGPIPPAPTTVLPLLMGIDRVTPGGNVNLLSVGRAMTLGNGQVLSVTDAYGRGVYYQTAYMANQNVPAGYSQGTQTLTQVSQIVATGAANPPMRYQFAYTNVPNGEGSESVPFLTGITVPSPTGSGTATAVIAYAPYTGYVTALTDANGNRVEFVSVDNSGNVVTTGSSNRTKVTVKDPAGTVVYWYIGGFNANMSRDRIIDAAGNTTSQEIYGSAVNPLRPTQAKDGMGRTWAYTWDQYGNILSKTTPRNLTTTYTYDYSQFVLGRLMTMQDGAKTPTTMTYYEPAGLINTVTSAAPVGSGVTTVQSSVTYSALGNPLTMTTAGNNAAPSQAVTLSYTTDGSYTQGEIMGRPILITDSLGNKTHLRYDVRGNLTSTTDVVGNVTSRDYNLANQVLAMVLPGTGQTGTGNGKVTQDYQYVGGPLLISKVYNESLALVSQVLYTYGKESEVSSVTGNVAEVVSYTYDALYRVKTQSDGNGNTTMWNYNAQGYLSGAVLPAGETYSYTSYNNAGQPTRIVDGRGIPTTYGYSVLDGQVESITFPAPNDNANVSYAYDDYGRLQTRTDSSGEQDYFYGMLDEFSQVVTTYRGLPSKTISYTYYPDGTRKVMTSPSGSFTNLYDTGGRLLSLTNTAGEVTTWTYYNNDQVQSQTLANGQQSSRVYDAQKRLTSLSNISGSVSMPSFSSMLYDMTGNRRGVTVNGHTQAMLNGTTTYNYDQVSRLGEERSTRAGGYDANYAYDSSGNVTNFAGQTRMYNTKNQNSSTGFVYDANGNPTTYNGQTITWDVFNNPVQLGNVMTAGYTSEGLRVWKQNTNTSERTYFLYDGIFPVCELDGTGGIKATNTFGGTGLISRSTSAGSTFYVWDEHGSASQRRDSNLNLLSSHGFDAWGNPLPGTSSVASTRDPYAGYKGEWGYYTDLETGLALCTFRYYDPTQGRWLNRDPDGYPGGLNLYGYCQSNPVKFSDPLGTVCTQQQLALYHMLIHSFCDQKTGCGRNDSDNDLVSKAKTALLCALTRINREVQCFSDQRGDDPNKRNHINAIQQALVNAARCLNIKKNRDRARESVRIHNPNALHCMPLIDTFPLPAPVPAPVPAPMPIEIEPEFPFPIRIEPVFP